MLIDALGHSPDLGDDNQVWPICEIDWDEGLAGAA